jgi:hypothetical protein
VKAIFVNSSPPLVTPTGSASHDLIVGHFNLLPSVRFDPGRDRTLLVVYEVVYSSVCGGLPIRVIAEPLD